MNPVDILLDLGELSDYNEARLDELREDAQFLIDKAKEPKEDHSIHNNDAAAIGAMAFERIHNSMPVMMTGFGQMSEKTRFKQEIDQAMKTLARGMREGSISEGSISEGSISEGSISEGSISEGSISEGSISEGSISEGSISESGLFPLTSSVVLPDGSDLILNLNIEKRINYGYRRQ